MLSAKAQIVNIESSRIQTDTTGWAGSAGAAFSFTKNTQQILTINLDAHLQYKTEKSLWLLLGDYGFLKGGTEKFLLNSFGHLRYNRKINPWLRWEIFSQVQSNHIMQIRSRYLNGTGPRLKLISGKMFRLYAASLLMYEHETERTKPAIVHNDFRSSSYLSFTFIPAPNIELISTTFYQPLFRELNDYRIFNQSTLEVEASKRFSLYIRWNWLFDTRPAGTAPRTNYQLVSGFQVEF
jgi:putative salt-induced outer membrane protein YdiY